MHKISQELQLNVHKHQSTKNLNKKKKSDLSDFDRGVVVGLVSAFLKTKSIQRAAVVQAETAC